MTKMIIRKFFGKAAAAFCFIAACAGICGCDMRNGRGGELVGVQSSNQTAGGAARAYLPVRRGDGRKFKMACVDIDPYPETFRMVYYVVESLKADGWISYDGLPFDPDTDSDTKKMLDWLADNAVSEYMEFDRDVHYYTSVSSETEIYESLRAHIEEKKDIDLILTLGTSPSAMVREFGFDIPLLMYAVSDPVGSGLVESAEHSGNKNYWAHVDSSAYSRQMQYYYNTFKFRNIGSVYGDEIVSGMPEYRRTARENGFEITEYRLERESMDEDRYYAELSAVYEKMIHEDGVDAYILHTNVIPDAEQARELMQVFFDAGIPVFAQVGSAYVAEGAALMIVDPRDAAGIAPFVSNIIGSVFNGSDPGDLEQVYVSSPYLMLNLDVAEKIKYRPSFEMLIACEKIIYGNDRRTAE